jgi:SAM-dependent methyltransferase
MLLIDENRPPLPPPDLMLRVVMPFEVEDIEDVRRSFDMEGLNNLRMFESALSAVPRWRLESDPNARLARSRSFADFDRLLDFGCGCGRFVRHLGPLSDHVEIHGTDIDADMIEWLRANVPFGHFEVAPHEPPLAYPDHHFDLVINHSVFSHLDERHQDLWLDELHRITRPDGFVLATVEGQSSWARTKQSMERVGGDVEPWEAELETRGILFIKTDAWIGSTHPDFYHSTVHAPWYVFEHWSRFFDVYAYLPDGSWAQDLVVLRRRADGAPPAAPPIPRRLAPAPAAPHPVPEPPARPEPQPPAARGPFDLLAAMRRRGRPALASVGRRGRGADPSAQAPQPSEPEPSEPDPRESASAELAREVAMIRVGLYEQGRRISVLTESLREEIRALGPHDDGG